MNRYAWLLTLLLSIQVGPLLAASRTEQIAQKVYARLASFPKAEIPGKPESTLVRRILLYHISVRGRPETSRLDWKLTLSDYLGYNMGIDPTSYPDFSAELDTLNKDKALIDALSRREREALIDALIQSLRR